MIKIIFNLMSIVLSASSFAGMLPRCSSSVIIEREIFERLIEVGKQEIFKKEKDNIHAGRVLLVRITVETDGTIEKKCLVTKSIEIIKGKEGEATLNVIVSAEISKTGELDLSSVSVTREEDEFSGISPTFNQLLEDRKRMLAAEGINEAGIMSSAFQSLRPALAVRGASCLVCHANVNANMITDFGYRDPYFMETSKNTKESTSVYFNHGLAAWQTAHLNQSLIIPRMNLIRPKNDAQLNTVDPLKKIQEISLAEFLKLPRVSSVDGSPFTATSGHEDADGEMAKGVRQIVEKNSIYIGAPTTEEIINLAGDKISEDTGFIWVQGEHERNKKTVQPIPLKVVSASAGKYVTHENSRLICHGDLVIKGTLFLKDVIFDVNHEGCRLYVSGSVFIQGAPKFILSDDESVPGVQITSAIAIVMGFSLSTLSTRLELTHLDLLSYFKTRTGNPLTNHKKILSEATLFGSQLLDAGNRYTPMSGLLLNAPEVLSRYRGPFRGSIIAEIAIMRLNEFDFSFDENLLDFDLFPLLKRPILEVSKR